MSSSMAFTPVEWNTDYFGFEEMKHVLFQIKTDFSFFSIVGENLEFLSRTHGMSSTVDGQLDSYKRLKQENDSLLVR